MARYVVACFASGESHRKTKRITKNRDKLMKLFLKTYACFAYMAFMLCVVACSEDETADRVTIPAAQPEAVTITAGNGKFDVEWSAPDDSNAEYCVISWSGAGKGSVALYMTDGNYTVSNLSAGDYTVSVQSYGNVELDSPAVEEDIYVYDYTSYTTLPTVKSMFIDSTDVVVEWNEAPEDCMGVIVSYTDIYGNAAKTSLTSIEQPVLVTNAQSGSSFTYTSQFKPATGIDEVSISDAASAGTFPTLRNNAQAPLENVMVLPGDFAMRVKWETTDTPKKIVITYDDGELTRYHYVEEFMAQAADSVLIEGLDVDMIYDITVRSVSTDGNVSASSTVDDIQAYDWISYGQLCPPPTFSQSVYYGDDYQMRIYWTEVPECKNLTLKYVTGITGATKTLTDLALDDELLILDDCMPGSDYVATATYVPYDNSIDTLYRTTNATFPDAEVWKYSQDRDDANASSDYKWSRYEMEGDAAYENSDSTDPDYFTRMFDSWYEGSEQYITEEGNSYPGQTVTIDLGRIYKLSKFSYTPYYDSSTGTNPPYEGKNIKKFSLYGTSHDLANDDYGYDTYYTITAATSQATSMKFRIPYLTNWDCLLDNVEVSTSTLDSSTVTEDYRSFVFNISDTCDPVRYIKIQFHESFDSEDNTYQYRINEIGLWHRGVWDDESEYK